MPTDHSLEWTRPERCDNLKGSWLVGSRGLIINCGIVMRFATGNMCEALGTCIEADGRELFAGVSIVGSAACRGYIGSL
jgi:hypothetical protein